MKADKTDVKYKKLHIEVLRIIAAFLVIVNHTNSVIFLDTQPSPLWFGSISYFFVSKTAVPVFVMIMGAVLLGKQDDIKKYISRIVRIAAVIAVITPLAYVAFIGDIGVKGFVREILYSSIDLYWYLYLYIGMLVILPVMQRMAKAFSKQDMQIVILLSLVVGGFVPMLEFVGLKVHDAFFYGLFSPYIGMAFAGYYIERYMVLTKRKAVLAAAGLAVMTVLQDMMALKSYHTRGGEDYLWMDNAKFITVTIGAVCLYIFVKYIFDSKNVSAERHRAIGYIGSLTFGVYLFGEFFKEALVPLYAAASAAISPMPAVIIYEIAIFAGAAVLTAILKFIPVIKKFI